MFSVIYVFRLFLASVVHLKTFQTYFSNHFYLSAFWESSRLAASGLICEQRLIWKTIISFYCVMTLCYCSGWRGLLWPRTIWNLNPITMRSALLSPCERLSLSFWVRFCPVISFTHCTEYIRFAASPWSRNLGAAEVIPISEGGNKLRCLNTCCSLLV